MEYSMARITRRKRKRRAREALGSSFESEGGGSGGREDEREESEKQDRRWQLRRSTLESRAKGKEVVVDGEEEAKREEQQDLQKEQQQLQERRHSKGAIPKEEICGICLSEGENARGKLDCCDHFFCFPCIMEWSKVESRCPMCKQRFITVVRTPFSGVSRSRSRRFRIPTRDQVYEPFEEDPLDLVWRTLGEMSRLIHIDTTFDMTGIDEQESSGTDSIIGMIVGDVQPNLFAGRTRRSAAAQEETIREE